MVKEQAAESPRVDEALQLEVVDRTAADATIVEGVEAETGDWYFPALVRRLADALGVQYAFVSEMSEDRTRFRTLAVWGRGAFLSNFEVPLRGTPCETVLNGHISHHPRHLQLLFPNDTVLVAWGGRATAGRRSSISPARWSVTSQSWMTSLCRMVRATCRSCGSSLRASARRSSGIGYSHAFGGESKLTTTLYEEAPVAYVSVGTDGRIRKANRRAAELFQ